MGSSKKHKDRDREHKRRKKHRSRSRSRSPVRSRSRERKVKDRERPSTPPVELSRERHRPEEEERRRRRCRGSEEEEEDNELRSKSSAARAAERRAEQEELAGSGAGASGSHGDEQQRSGGGRHERRPPAEDGDDDEAPSGGGASLSLSIEETNKLRAKLGLKPLEMNTSADSKGKEKESLKDDIHRPAINLAEKKRTEVLRQKLNDVKQKRKIADKLKKVKSLGDSDGEDDARAWVRKSRQAEVDKKQAEQRAKQLQQMDEEFGVSSLVAEELGSTKEQPSYTQSHLKGLRVEHAESRFEAGTTVVLTLADKGVLDEDEDALINVDMVDLEKAEKNKINKSQRPDYKAYEDEEEDEYGMLQQRDVLKKYDEEIEGEKKKSFTLGRGGTYSGEDEKAMQQIRAQLQSGKLTLETAAPRVASEYYSKEEMETFKKRTKKVRKIRKKVMKADDLLALGDDHSATSGGGRDLSSRSGKWVQPGEGEDGRRAGVEGEPAAEPAAAGPEPAAAGPDGAPTAAAVGGGKVETDRARAGGGQVAGRRLLPPPPPIDDTDDIGPDEDLTGIVIDDEAQNELQSALIKAIKLKQKREALAAGPASERLSAQLLAIKPEPASPEHGPDALLPVKKEADGSIVLNVTDEFCRTLGNIPTYGQSGNREETEEELMDFERELLEQRRLQEEEEEKGGWEEVGIDDRKVEVGGTSEDAAILDDEPVVTSGVASALALAHKKGFIEQEVQRRGKTVRNAEELLAKNYSIEDKRYDDIDEKYRKRGDRFSGGGGALTDFKEKEGYVPDFRLEYIDEKGRKLNSKEAFRQLSHRFHGKGSGKKKTEKRSKKVDEELLMKQMSSTDTPLNTLSRLIEKQEKEKAPYIVLSGGQRTMTSNTVMK